MSYRCTDDRTVLLTVFIKISCCVLSLFRVWEFFCLFESQFVSLSGLLRFPGESRYWVCKNSYLCGLWFFYQHMSAFFLFTHDFVWLTICFIPSLTPGPMGSQSLYWFWESTPTKSLHWSHWLPVTLPLKGIGGLHSDPESPETLMCQALSCPGLTRYILFCDHKCDLKIGVFAYLYVWMQYRVATSTCAYSSFRGLVLLFVSQKPLPCRFSEKCLCVAG